MVWRKDQCSSSVGGMASRWLFQAGMTLVLALVVSCQKSSSTSSSPGPQGGGTTTVENDTSGTEVEVSGSVSEEAATEFVQATDSVSVAGVNLTTLSTGYSISAFALDSKGQRKLVFSGKFPSRFFYFKSRFPRQYLQIEAIRLTDSGKFGAVLPPPVAPKSVIMRLGRTETIASKKFDLIASKAASGHAGAIKALSTGSISVADTLAVAQSVRRVLDQKINGISTPASVDLGSFAQNLIDKSNAKMEALEAEGIANQTLADKISDRTYETVFGPQAEKTPVGVLAHRTNPELGSSAAALTDVAYESIKASTAPGVEAVKVAFKSEAEAYRTAATVEIAAASEKQVATAYSLSYSQCAAGNSSACVSPTYVPPPPPSYGTPTNIVLGTVATPVPTPPASVYQVSQAVALSTTTTGAGIYYTLDGSVPTSSSTLYAGPIFVGVSQTVRAIAVRPGYISSNVVTLNYTITGTVQPPVISKGTGSYAGSQIVTLGSSTPGATVYYTLDGSDPSRASNQYSDPLVITSSQTLKAFAVLTNWNDSTVSSASYTINDFVDSPTFSVPSGGYGPPQSVSIISGTLGATIYYTIDGSTPTTSSLVYSEPIGVSSGMTIKAFATKEFYSDSPVVTAVYSINGSVATPTASLGSGSYTNAQSVELLTATPGAQIYYTVDGSVPSSSSTPYYGPILVAVSQTIRAIAFKAGFSPSGSSSFVYSVTGTVQAPVFSVGSGSYANEQFVSLSSSTPGASIYFTTDGSDPSRSSVKYTGPITVTESKVIKAFAVLTGWADSSPSSESYVILEKAATPVADVTPGFFSTARSVSLSSSTAGAEIRYTLDGSVPSASSPLYSTPIFVGVSQTIKAVAIKSGYANSLMGVFSYTITGRVQTPTFSLLEGDYPRAQTVNLSSATPGASIYYTTDGSSPSRSSVRYTMPLYVSSTQTIKAFAVLENWDDSFESISSYTINPPVSAPQFSPAGGIYSTSQTVTLSSATAGAVIYYTTNGATPTTSSTQYSGPISVSSITTIKAIAVKDGLDDSTIVTSVYTISTSSVAVSIDFSANSTTLTPSDASPTTTSAVASLSALVALTGGNPISTLNITGAGTFTINSAESSWVTLLSIRGSSTVVNINSAFANNPTLQVEDSALVGVNTADVVFNAVTIGTENLWMSWAPASTITTSSYTGLWNGSSYDSLPGAGNGQLHLNVLNALTIGGRGLIQMDGKGYRGGQTVGENGYSVNGPNTLGAGKGGNAGSAGSYASQACNAGGSGTGSVFGAGDFWTQLYMGSGGGSRNGLAGGNGGGVIKITAGSFSNSGTVRSEGANASSNNSGGSGGTIYFSVSGSFANNATISANGQDCGGYGRVRIEAGALENSPGNIYGMVHSNIVNNLTSSITSVSYTPNQLEIVDNAKTYRMGYISGVPSLNYGWESALSGKSIGTFTISAGSVLSFNNATNIAISNLRVRDSNTVVNINSRFANNPTLQVEDSALVGVNTADVVFNAVTIGTENLWMSWALASTITTGSYTGVWNGSSYDSLPSAGNGQLHLNVLNALTIGGRGLIQMDGKGYRGGQTVGENGYSVNGPNTLGAGKGGNAGSAGSYASQACNAGGSGTGAVFGASDFWTQLYMGSGGGSRNGLAGGNGGGVIKITAGSFNNSGNVRAEGSNASTNNSGGSGGTIHFNVTGSFANNGAISTNGSDCGGYGRVRIEAGSLENSPGNIYGMVHSNIVSNLTSSITSVGYNPSQLEIVDSGKTYRMGYISGTPSLNYGWESALSGKTIGTFTVSAGSVLAFNNATNITVGNLRVRDSNTVININSRFANNPTLQVEESALVGVNTSDVVFDAVTIGTENTWMSWAPASIITTSSFTGVWSGSSYDSLPGAGNGQLHLNVLNALTIGGRGLIQMDGKGYRGGQTVGENGYSVNGPNTLGAGKGGNAGSAGSYASQACNAGASGTGAVFGAGDFWTELYMGSGGGSRNGLAGGNGGGAIKITAGSFNNSGTVRAEGGNSATNNSGGSGGTIHVNVTGSFANNGAISTNGADCGGYGRVRIDSGSLENSNGTIYGMVHSNIVSNLTPSITSVTYNPSQLEIVDNAKTYRMGYISGMPSLNYGWESALSGKSIGTFSVSAGSVLSFNNATNIAISTLRVRDNNAVVNINSRFANNPNLEIENGARVGVNTSDVVFNAVTIGTENAWASWEPASIITTNAYSGVWNGSSYDSLPSAGNGQLHLNVLNALTIGGRGLIQMDGKGYRGGLQSAEHGYSANGPNTLGAGKGGNGGSAGSYASHACNAGGSGTGSVFGASDFWTQLYMGSGGGSRNGLAGGNGGGAIKITAGSFNNSGTVRAEGGNSATNNSGGSGGTIYFSVSGSFANNATISANGQDCGGYGRVRIEAGSLENSPGNIYGMVHSNVVSNLTSSITSVSYNPSQLEIVDNAKTYRMGYISGTPSLNYGWESALSGKTIGTFTVPAGSLLSFNNATSITVNNLRVRDNNTVVNINSRFANNPNLEIENGALVGVNTADVVFNAVTIGTESAWAYWEPASIITTNAYSGVWNGASYDSLPSAGNGQLHLNVLNALTIGGRGLIQMDGKGYRGGQTVGENGYSFNGPNTLGAGKGGNAGSAGSYASQACNAGGSGTGSVFGASDFWTQLYMGSGGGSRNGLAGGNGGGAIKITAGSFNNSGTVRAEGGNSATNNSGGSGGTIHVNVTGSFANNGAISTNGQDCGGYGRVRIEAGSLENSPGNIYGMVHSNIVGNLTSSITSINYNLGQLEIVDSGKTYRMGYISGTPSLNYGWESALSGKAIGTFTVSAGSVLAFNNATNITVGNLRVRDSNTVVNINSGFANNPTLEIENGALVGVNTADVVFNAVTIGTENAWAYWDPASIITTNAYSGVWNGASYDSLPSAGNGQLHLNVLNALTIGGRGLIQMDGKGYSGGQQGEDHGYSVNGPNTLGAGKGGNSGSAGSYASQACNAGGSGTGAVFGASDFWTKLYMGSGGGSRNALAGGNGGGAIKIIAASFNSSGNVRAEGSNASTNNSGGSGGTIYVNVTGSFANSGTISTDGKDCGGYGRIRIDAGSLEQSTGNIKGLVDSNITDALSSSIDSFNFSGSQIEIVDNSKTIRMGYISSTADNNHAWEIALAGKSIGTFTVSSGAAMTFNAANTISITNLIVRDASSVLNINSGFANNPNLNVQNGALVNINTQLATFNSLVVGNDGCYWYGCPMSMVSSNGFSGTWNGSSYSSSPGAGNGQLRITATGAVTVGSSGLIHMDGKGYKGGQTTDESGFSVGGPGTSGAGKGGNEGSAGSYSSLATGVGSLGAGALYGTSDFWTQLYLGSGGGYRSSKVGGAGGGAIKITAGSFHNSGTVRAEGSNPSSSNNGGSGGTIFFDISGDFTNAGNISTNGQDGGGFGRIAVNYGSSSAYSVTGYYSPTVECNGYGGLPTCTTLPEGGDPIQMGWPYSLDLMNSSTTNNFNNIFSYSFRANEVRWFRVNYSSCSGVEDAVTFTNSGGSTGAFSGVVYDRNLSWVQAAGPVNGSYGYSVNSANVQFYADNVNNTIIGSACDSAASTSSSASSFAYIRVANGGTAQVISISWSSVGY